MIRLAPYLPVLLLFGAAPASANPWQVAQAQEQASLIGAAPEKSAGQREAEEIGSLRNSRVAVPMAPGKRVPLVYLAGRVVPPDPAEMARIAPNVRIVLGLNPRTALDHAAEADAVDSDLVTPEFLARAKKLVWVQSTGAGIENSLKMPGIAGNDALIFTNFRAVHGPAIADQAMGMLLFLTRDLRIYDRQQAEERWGRPAGPYPAPIALDGRTMLVVGIGGIGTEVAQRAHGFGMHVIATRRTRTPAPAYVERLGLAPDLLSMLPLADVVAICVPLTRETAHLFNRAAFAAMKPGAYLINVTRGQVVDTDALVEALHSGRLAGACLDVTDPEPLPPGHPLWRMPNVIITPHVSAESDVTTRRKALLLVENIRRFGAGEPLLNVVDKRAGY